MTNISRAIALIDSFSSGDIKVAKKYLKENYIQHNLEYKDGKQASIDVIEYITNLDINTLVMNVRAFEDSDYVILQNLYNFAGAGEQVAFDVFRFEDGMIAEHWDNIAPTTWANKSGHFQVDGTKKITDIPKTSENKSLVEKFVKEVLIEQELDKINTFFDGDNFIQHDSNIADGLSGLRMAFKEMHEKHLDMIYDKMHYIFGAGNFVLTISEGSIGDIATSYYDLFRIDNNKIAEHWDVMEPISKTPKNNNGKF